VKQKEIIALLKKYQKKMNKLDVQRYHLYEVCARKIGINEDNDYLFDFLFNNFGNAKKIAERAKRG
jgi:hypothetical protein